MLMLSYKKMYKIQTDDIIKRLSDGAFIPVDEGNVDYQKFKNDIYEKGIEIGEGADYVGVVSYTDARRAEYPPLEDQLDKIFHDGIESWRTDIIAIKDKYPKTQVGVTSISPLPQWVIDLTSS